MSSDFRLRIDKPNGAGDHCVNRGDRIGVGSNRRGNLVHPAAQDEAQRADGASAPGQHSGSYRYVSAAVAGQDCDSRADDRLTPRGIVYAPDPAQRAAYRGRPSLVGAQYDGSAGVESASTLVGGAEPTSERSAAPPSREDLEQARSEYRARQDSASTHLGLLKDEVNTLLREYTGEQEAS